MSKFWFDYTKDIVPNHMISVDVKDMPEFFQNEKIRWKQHDVQETEHASNRVYRSWLHHRKRLGKLQRKWYSLWNQTSGRSGGIPDKLPEPIYTPSTKADLGDHDENISFEQSVEVLEKLHPGKGEEYATKIKDATIALYKKMCRICFEQRNHYCRYKI